MREEARGSEYYPFKHFTEAVIFLMFVVYNLSEAKVKRFVESFKWGSPPDVRANCVECK